MKKNLLGIFLVLVSVLLIGNVYAQKTGTCTDPDEQCAASIGDVKYKTLDDALNDAEEGDTVKVLNTVIVGVTGGEQNKEGHQANGQIGRLASKNSPIHFTLDLNGQLLTSANSKPLLVIEDGSQLTIKDSTGSGKIVHTNGLPAILVSKGTAILDGGEITTDNGTGTYGAIQVGSLATNTAGNLIVNEGTKISGDYGIVYVNGSSVTVNGGSVSAQAFAISGNGTDKQITNTVTINGGTLTSENSAAIYQPNYTELNVKGGTITGKFGIVARQGTVNVTGGNITANGKAGEKDTVGDSEEELPSGTAIVIDNKSEGYGSNSIATISGGNFKSNGDPIATVSAEGDNVVPVTVTGGDFDKKVKATFLGKGLVQNADGTVGEPVAPSTETTNPDEKDDAPETNDVFPMALVGMIALGLAGTYTLKKLHN